MESINGHRQKGLKWRMRYLIRNIRTGGGRGGEEGHGGQQQYNGNYDNDKRGEGKMSTG